MGIRFSCSNGHKLNVKAELAGRKGRCPECGVSVQIPHESNTAEPKKDEPVPPISALLSDPNAVWYLQVPHGPQYGPATGAVFETWIKERRVSPNMLVWKEGWERWIEAKNVFPDLLRFFSGPLKTDLLSAANNEPTLSEVSAVSLTPLIREKIQKRKKLSRNTIILTVLVGMIFLLGVLLIWVLK